MKPSYDPESYRWLIGEFMRHATELAARDLISPGLLMNVKRKPQCVMPARRELVKRMRDGYMQPKSPPLKFFRTGDYFDDGMIIPLSAPVVASLFGGHHSTILLTEKRAALQEPKDG